MQDTEPPGPAPIRRAEIGEMFPSPFTALLITLAAIFATLLIASLSSGLPGIVALGIGEAIGLGGVATLAARRIPEPQAERLGLRGFDAKFILPLLALIPVVILVSEVDNWVRPHFPPSAELTELTAPAEDLSEGDALYDSIQTAIVSLGIVPVVEVFLFMGVLLQGLVAHVGRRQGVLLTVALYQLLHFPLVAAPGDAIVPILTTLLIGALLCLARLATGSLLAAISLGVALGATVVFASALSEVIAIPGFNAEGPHTSILLLVPCVAAVTFGVTKLVAAARAAPALPGALDCEEVSDHDPDEGFHF